MGDTIMVSSMSTEPCASESGFVREDIVVFEEGKVFGDVGGEKEASWVPEQRIWQPRLAEMSQANNDHLLALIPWYSL